MADSARREQLAWKVVSRGAAVLGAVATRNILQAAWPSGDDQAGPPYNPADRRVPWRTAMEWGVAAGVGAGIARVMSQRAAAAGWERATGNAPPGIQS